jgi:hypothetical protein
VQCRRRANIRGPSSFGILRFVLAILGRYMRGAYNVSGSLTC